MHQCCTSAAATSMPQAQTVRAQHELLHPPPVGKGASSEAMDMRALASSLIGIQLMPLTPPGVNCMQHDILNSSQRRMGAAISELLHCKRVVLRLSE